MRIIILITTFNRLPYINQLIESIRKHQQPQHQYQIVVNDDGSTDGTREYLESQHDIHVLYSNNKHVHHADNNLILYANSQQYDFGFKMDDDVFIVQKGWEDLYYKASQLYSVPHLVHHSYDWDKVGKRVVTPLDCQGAFWTFTPEALANIGFIDEKSFGRRGFGHGDFTARACRMGYNREGGLIDAENSNDYIRLHVDDYVFTPGYDEELKVAMQDADFKKSQIVNPDRLYMPLFKSVINHFFDHVYVLNLKRRPDRRKRMEHLLTANKIYDFEFWDSVDGNEVENKTGLPNGAHGCALSHISIYEDIKAKGYKRALILEDDLIFINDLHKSLLSLYDVPNDWGLLYLGASDYNHVNCDVKSPFYRGFRIDGTFAYAVNGNIIDDVISSAKQWTRIPIDTRLHGVQQKYRSYIIHPMTCIADLQNSDIRPDRETEQHAKLVNWDLKLYTK